MKNYDYSILIGRFQPFHLAHYQLLQKALKIADKAIIVIGSHNSATNIRNPWTADQRKDMIQSVLSEEDWKRVEFIYMKDSLYNDNLWITSLQEKVKSIASKSKIILVGCDYDSTTYYLNMFPQWDLDLIPNMNDYLRASDIRAMYFEENVDYRDHLHEKTAEYLNLFKATQYDKFHKLKEEYEFIQKYKELWNSAPFPPTFVTVDAVVIKSGHILVVRRGGKLGKGLIALPGGFLGQNEKIKNAMLRELKEETGIKIPKKTLRTLIKDSQVFDHPNRSLRGRTITHAYLIDLDSGELPKVKGNDDADKAWWMPLNEFYAKEDKFFEDHWHIINHFISKY